MCLLFFHSVIYRLPADFSQCSGEVGFTTVVPKGLQSIPDCCVVPRYGQSKGSWGTRKVEIQEIGVVEEGDGGAKV